MFLNLSRSFFLFIIALGFLRFSYAAVESNTTNINLIEAYLSKINKNSSVIRTADYEFKSSQLLKEIELSEFDWSANLNLSRLSAQDPQRNPFSPTRNEVNTLGLGVQKKWISGFETALNYNVTDNLIEFPGNELVYFFPDLSLSFKTNLTDDLIYRKSKNLSLKVKESLKSLEIEKNILVRNTLVEALLQLVTVLETKNEIKIEDQICQEIEKQNRVLAKRRALGSVSRRDFLTSQKEVNSCQIKLKSLKNQKLKLVKNLETQYGLSRSDYSDIEIENLFTQAKAIFNNYKNVTAKLNFENNLDANRLKQQLNFLMSEGKQLKAMTALDVNLEAKYGLRGLNENFSEAQGNISDSDFQNYFVGINMKLPFKNRTEESLLASNAYKKDIVGVQFNQTLKQKQSNFYVLKQSLEDNLEIYETLLENNKLSRQILDEGLKDFSNGRIDFYNLTELRKAYIASQTQLTQTRGVILVNIVEYIDNFNYFERFYSL